MGPLNFCARFNWRSKVERKSRKEVCMKDKINKVRWLAMMWLFLNNHFQHRPCRACYQPALLHISHPPIFHHSPNAECMLDPAIPPFISDLHALVGDRFAQWNVASWCCSCIPSVLWNPCLKPHIGVMFTSAIWCHVHSHRQILWAHFPSWFTLTYWLLSMAWCGGPRFPPAWHCCQRLSLDILPWLFSILNLASPFTSCWIVTISSWPPFSVILDNSLKTSLCCSTLLPTSIK